MSKEIQLTQGQIAIVDDEDFDWLDQWKWKASKQRNNDWYAARRPRRGNRKKGHIFMHRLILNPSEGMQTHHIDHNGLNNQRANLRIVTAAQNQYNQRPQKKKSSHFKGVHWASDRRKWRAQIMVNGRTYRLGQFLSECEAAKAYDNAALRYFGEYAYANF